MRVGLENVHKGGSFYQCSVKDKNFKKKILTSFLGEYKESEVELRGREVARWFWEARVHRVAAFRS